MRRKTKDSIAFASLLARRRILLEWKSSIAPEASLWLKDLMLYLNLEKIKYNLRGSSEMIESVWGSVIAYTAELKTLRKKGETMNGAHYLAKRAERLAQEVLHPYRHKVCKPYGRGNNICCDERRKASSAIDAARRDARLGMDFFRTMEPSLRARSPIPHIHSDDRTHPSVLSLHAESESLRSHCSALSVEAWGLRLRKRSACSWQ
ncbi:hypothetical protein F7725_023282 [Dissostichus mawsoni]|uniref:Uncharacterized protein n=1 Tax=Dissostichus mawsoni TaxID=36200 RepID=A0A7J5Z355_DISMA|nr:hypothetical protein F7725_023282 [Dissostichus mawsoni]